MNIYAKEGDKVIYCNPGNGYELDQESCKKHLELNRIHTVKRTEVGQFEDMEVPE